jgi:DNA-binding transcriptional MerR regulator
MSEKLYYSMGEVTEMFDVEASLIRYWCSQFSCLRPKRNAKGNRMFSPQDIERLKRIHHLLKEKKMTIEGAQKAMRKRNIEAEKNDSDITLLEQLQSLRAMLVDMRNNMGEPLPEESIVEESHVEEPHTEELCVEPAEPIVDPIVDPIVEQTVEVEPEVEAQVEEPVETSVEVSAELTIEDIFEDKSETVVAATTEPEPIVEAVEIVEVAEQIAAEEPVSEEDKVAAVEAVAEPQVLAKPKKKRAPRRKLIGEEGVVERPLFPFYEQTLF